MRSFIVHAEQVVEQIKETRNPEEVIAALEWFDAALPRSVGSPAVRQAVAQAGARIAGLRNDAAQRGPLRIAAPYELKLIVNRFRGLTLDGNPSGCCSSPAQAGQAVQEPWLSSDVLSLALACHQEGEDEWRGLPLLADALLDAGCDNALLLDHLRAPGPHLRACWALGAVLRHAGRITLPVETARRLAHLFHFHPAGRLVPPGAPSLGLQGG
jgi:hypothetical protein